MAGQLEPQYRKNYILGGNATVTLVSRRTGDRYTYRVRQGGAPETPLHFVSVLTGPDNRRDYQFLGTIFSDGVFRHGRKSKLPETAPSARAWNWTWHNLGTDQVEVWHEGTCSRCGRPLTDPASIARGLGPVCADKEL